MNINQNLASSLVSILRKIEIMTENVIVSNEQNYLILSSVDSILKSNPIGRELKTQTGILTSIKLALGKNKFKQDDIKQDVSNVIIENKLPNSTKILDDKKSNANNSFNNNF